MNRLMFGTVFCGIFWLLLSMFLPLCKEELVAEMGSATIMNVLGLETDSFVRNNAAYIQSWIKALQNDKRLIVTAASQAGKAVNLIMPGVVG